MERRRRHRPGGLRRRLPHPLRGHRADGSTPADRIRTADDFTAYLEWWHGQHPDAVFTAIGDAVDGRHGRIIWDMEAGEVHVGGVDVFDFDEDGRVTRVWSAGGQRSMRA
ncbi:MAG: hypothetical protein V4755_13375 [Curtobacterium sp.]